MILKVVGPQSQLYLAKKGDRNGCNTHGKNSFILLFFSYSICYISLSALIFQENYLTVILVSCFGFNSRQDCATKHRDLRHEPINLIKVDFKYSHKFFHCKKFSWMVCQVLFGLQTLTMSHANERSLEIIFLTLSLLLFKQLLLLTRFDVGFILLIQPECEQK